MEIEEKKWLGSIRVREEAHGKFVEHKMYVRDITGMGSFSLTDLMDALSFIDSEEVTKLYKRSIINKIG